MACSAIWNMLAVILQRQSIKDLTNYQKSYILTLYSLQVMTTTIQDIFEMRKNGQFEQAYAAVLPMYREHHGHYTTLCMFWTATDVMRLRIDSDRCVEAEQILASLRNLYPNLQDHDRLAARTLTRLALMLATKEQELRKMAWDKPAAEKPADTMHFSLLDYMADFGLHFLSDEDWQAGEWNGHVVPSMGVKILCRIYHEVAELSDEETDRLEAAKEMVEIGLRHAPRNKHLLRYQAILLYRLGEKQRAVLLYRQLIGRSRDSYLFSELAAMVDDRNEQTALLSKAIMNQRTEVFAQKDRLSLAGLLKELFPRNAAYELQRVVELRNSLGQQMNKAIRSLQQELANITPVNMADQKEFYLRLIRESPYAVCG